MRERKITPSVPLRGGQSRLKEMVLYVAERCVQAERFGAIKLNKILWKSDFDAYVARGVPVTGRPYQRLALGPAPKEMLPIRREMLQGAQIRIDIINFADGKQEHRTIALVSPDLSKFSKADLAFVDSAIEYYWTMTGEETSDDSHGMPWKSRANGDPMPYESALLSNRVVGITQLRRLQKEAFENAWTTE